MATGGVTTVPWGIVFPQGGPLPRHPSQLYEAFLEGAVLCLVLHGILRYLKLKPGQLFSCYMILYGLFRFILEYFREPDSQLGFFFHLFTMGQLLCLTMVMLGLTLYLYTGHRSKNSG